MPTLEESEMAQETSTPDTDAVGAQDRTHGVEEDTRDPVQVRRLEGSSLSDPRVVKLLSQVNMDLAHLSVEEQQSHSSPSTLMSSPTRVVIAQSSSHYGEPHLHFVPGPASDKAIRESVGESHCTCPEAGSDSVSTTGS